MRILMIEDDRRLARLVTLMFANQHFTVDVAHDGDTGLTMALQGIYDVAIVDWLPPERDGLTICRAVRAARLPIALLMLTARGQLEERVFGLDSGADGYLIKRICPHTSLAAAHRPTGHRWGRIALRRPGARFTRPCRPPRRSNIRINQDRVGSARVVYAPSWTTPHPPVNPRLRLVGHYRGGPVTGERLHLLPATQAQSNWPAQLDSDHPWRRLSSGGGLCLTSCGCV